MSGDLPDEMQSVLSNLDSSLTSLEEHLNPLFDVPWDELSARLDPVEKAKLNLMMAYSAASLFYMYLKSQVNSVEYVKLTRKFDIDVSCNREYPQRTIR